MNNRLLAPALLALAFLLCAATEALATAAPVRPAVHPPAIAASANLRTGAGDGRIRLQVIPRPVRAHAAEISKMQHHLDTLYERAHVKHTFHLDHDVIECVDIEHQPAMKNPLLRGHRILSPPAAPHQPTGHAGRVAPNHATSVRPRNLQIFAAKAGRDPHGHPTQCPRGTIPIRKPSLAELKAFATLGDFHKKYPSHLNQNPHRPTHTLQKKAAAAGKARPAPAPPAHPSAVPAFGSADNHQYAKAPWNGIANHGAHTNINIWSPYVYNNSEFSLSQIWVVRGFSASNPSDMSHVQTLEAGVQVFHDKYGDNRPHLFVYSTSDGYQHDNYASGCYNLDCGRFVQTNPYFVAGSAINYSSVYNGPQYDIEVQWVKGSNAWWLWVDGQWLGYYPIALFNNAGLADHADFIDFGGEIIDNRAAHSWHTLTRMGSGAYAEAGFSKAAYHRRIWYYDTNGVAKWATGVGKQATNTWCYDATQPVNSNDPNWGTYFFFGGPGYNIMCQ